MHAGGATEATGTGHPALGTGRLAATARGRSHADHALREEALRRVRQDLVRTVEFLDAEVGWLGILARALVAQRDVRRDDRALGRQLAFQQRGDGGLGQLRRRRAAGHVVVHVHHLVERAHDVVQRRQRRLAAFFLEGDLRTDLRLLVDDGGAFLVVELEDLLAGELVGQGGNAAGDRADTVGNQVLALATEQPRHFLLLGRADGAVEERRDDGLVRHRLDVLVLEVHRDGPEDDVHDLDHAQDVLGEVHDGFFTASTGGAPVKSDFWLRHGQWSPSCRGRHNRNPTQLPGRRRERRNVPFPNPNR